MSTFEFVVLVISFPIWAPFVFAIVALVVFAIIEVFTVLGDALKSWRRS